MRKDLDLFLNAAICLVLACLTFPYCTATAATVTIESVQQLKPWGKVAIDYTVTGTPKAIDYTVVDMVSKKNYYPKSLSGDTTLASGKHRVIWDMAADGVSISSTNVYFNVDCVDVYCVIDLSGGASATSYPVSYLDDVPPGGWTDEYKTTKLVLRFIAPGSFIMGDDQADASHRVTLTKPFYMGVFEVTQKQWELVMGSWPNSSPSSRSGQGDAYPAYFVSYNNIRGSSSGAQWPSSAEVDATSFLGKLRAKTGLAFDLPTEAQWEYACRAGSTTTYSWGGAMDGAYAWYSGNASSTTHPVGTKMPNAWGLYDMSGNVWEWCLDWYDSLAYGTDPMGSSSGSYRVLRGGSSNGSASYCTSSYRNFGSPSLSSSNSGFRLSRTLP